MPTLLELCLYGEILLKNILHDAHHAAPRALLVALHQLHQPLGGIEERVAVLLLQAASVPDERINALTQGL